MLGAITGDIIGSRFEFNNTDGYGFYLFDTDCSFTDDTICTVAIADAILKGISYKDSVLPKEMQDVVDEFQARFCTKPEK